VRPSHFVCVASYFFDLFLHGLINHGLRLKLRVHPSKLVAPISMNKAVSLTGLPILYTLICPKATVLICIMRGQGNIL